MCHSALIAILFDFDLIEFIAKAANSSNWFENEKLFFKIQCFSTNLM
jgi:hypothetical protein